MTRRLFAGKDFTTAVAEVKSRLTRKFPEIQLDFTNDLTALIVEVIAYFSENVNFFQDLQGAETYSETAQQARSVQRISGFSAYNPPGAVPASGEVSVSLQDVLVNTVQIQEGQGFTASNGLSYEAAEEVLFSPGETGPKTVPLSQVETRSVTFRSDGTRFQRFQLDVREGEYLAFRSLEVLVDNEEWAESDAFLDTDTDVFRVSYIGDPIELEFGDGAVGAVPPDGAEIAVTYRVTAGIDGAIPEPGRITAASPGLVAGGESVSITIDETTGVMSGGREPESPVVVKTKIPLAEHSDGAVVTPPDFTGLVTRFRDPTFGAIAAATAVVATAIENDLFSVQSLGRMRGLFFDAEDVVDEQAALIRQVRTDVDDALDIISDLAATILGLSEAGGDIRAEMDDIRGQRDGAQTSVNSASSEIDSIQSLIDGIGTGPDALTDPTRGTLTTSLALIESQLAAIKSQLAAIETSTENVDESSEDVETNATSVQTQVTMAKGETANIETAVVALETDLVDPWTDAIDEVAAMEAHLDEIFADDCGPNLVSVPILVRDSDGFFAAPSVGLIRALESYLQSRTEPSAVFRVLDGSLFLVAPTIQIVFEPLAGEVPSKIKAAYEAVELAFIKTLDFGAALNLDDLYDQARSVGRVVSVNIEITDFTASNNSPAFIDAEGNLVVGEREIVNEPVIVYFRKFSNGSKELI